MFRQYFLADAGNTTFRAATSARAEVVAALQTEPVASAEKQEFVLSSGTGEVRNGGETEKHQQHPRWYAEHEILNPRGQLGRGEQFKLVACHGTGSADAVACPGKGAALPAVLVAEASPVEIRPLWQRAGIQPLADALVDQFALRIDHRSARRTLIPDGKGGAIKTHA